MPIQPSDQEEFNEQISGFYRREPSHAEAKRKLASHSGELLKSLPGMIPILSDYPVYAAVAFHGKFDWVDKRSISSLASKNAPAIKALQEIRTKKALRVAASAKAGWDSLLQESPDALWLAIQMNLAGWKAPMSRKAEDGLEEEEQEDHNDLEENEDDEH